jgi:CTP:molybdopterin cytidylyltransferase MocA
VGHPVLIGRDHWSGVRDVAAGDRGARDYLSRREVRLLECSDLGSGEDVDTPAGLAAWRAGEGFG